MRRYVRGAPGSDVGKKRPFCRKYDADLEDFSAPASATSTFDWLLQKTCVEKKLRSKIVIVFTFRHGDVY